MGQDVQLFVEGKNLVDLDFFTVSDPICSLKIRDSNVHDAEYKLSGETEVIDNNLNPLWIEHFTVLYSFKRDTELYFEVSNYNNATDRELIGEVVFNLSELMTAGGLTVTKTLRHPEKGDKSRGLLKVRGDKIKNTEDRVKFQICANLKSKKFACFGANNPYLLIERARNTAKQYGTGGNDSESPEESVESWYDLEMKNKELDMPTKSCGEKLSAWFKSC